MSENQDNYVKAVLGFDAVVQRADPSRWGDASPCEGWAARDVVNHMVFMADMVAGMASGSPAVVEGDAGAPALDVPGHVLRHELLEILTGPLIGAGDDPAAVWVEHRDALIAAVADPAALDVPTLSPWGHATTDAFLPMAGGDAVVHTWDLAEALGQDPMIEPKLAEAAIRAWADAAAAGSPIRQPMILDDPLPCSDGDDPVARLVAFMGRSTH